MSIDSDTPLREIAFEVCTALARTGTTAVLSGGGAATLYAPSVIQSYDLDFIITLFQEGGAPGTALEALGYRLAGHHHEHAASEFLVEFPPGPLAIGDDLITDWDILRDGDRLLHVLSPRDSCRDRLAAHEADSFPRRLVQSPPPAFPTPPGRVVFRRRAGRGALR